MADATETRAVTKMMAEIHRCRICVETPTGAPLPHAPRPVTVLSSRARVCICGQAPGTRVHASGQPFTDPSGDRLRDWMGIDADVFYDASRVAIVPMGFCFPGLDAKGGDLPPRKECAQAWHTRVFEVMPQLELMLLVGMHAQKWHLARQGLFERGATLTQTVSRWSGIYHASATPRILVLPHPSWRNTAWLKRNPWFEAEVLPVLRSEVARCTE